MTVTNATLTISSKNYSSWSLRGWLLCRFAGLAFVEQILPSDDPAMRAELLLLSPSFLVPRLTHGTVVVWDTLAIAEYLNDIKPRAGLLPKDRAAAAHCRSISGEMHGGFQNLRSALPMNLKGSHPGFKIWAGAQADIDRIVAIWNDCLTTYGGPFLFGETRTIADAMYAPVATRFRTYDVGLDAACSAYAAHLLALPEMIAWQTEALAEPDEVEELDAEF
jgi:glutathione S-transferase